MLDEVEKRLMDELHKAIEAWKDNSAGKKNNFLLQTDEIMSSVWYNRTVRFYLSTKYVAERQSLRTPQEMQFSRRAKKRLRDNSIDVIFATSAQ